MASATQGTTTGAYRTANPAVSTAAQNEGLAHDTASKIRGESTRSVPDQDPEYVRALPATSTAAQNEAVAHDTPAVA